MAQSKAQKPERRAKAPERMNPGQTAVLIALGTINPFEGINRRELDTLAENPFTVPSLESVGFIYTHGKLCILTAKGWGWLLRVITEIENRFKERGEDSENGQKKGDPR